MTDVGRTGEAVAAKYYQQRGWQVHCIPGAFEC